MGDPKELGEMAIGTLENIISKELEIHPENKYMRVILGGGEPTLHSNLDQIVEYLDRIPIIRVVLETNGVNVEEPNFVKILNYFKYKHFLKIALYGELLWTDTEYANKLIEFIHFAQQIGLRYVLNVRYVDETDKARLEEFIHTNKLESDFGELQLYPIYDCNLYRDGTLPNYDFSFVSYDYDGKTLLWHQKNTVETPESDDIESTVDPIIETVI
jgi:hypothetical protein